MKIISGTALSKEIKNKLATDIEALRAKFHRAPKLAIVLVGDEPDSLKYVNSKAKACADIGMECELRHLPESTTQPELLKVIRQLNDDNTVDGILIQLPLPKHLDSEETINAIDPRKDADGLHPENVGKLSDGGKGILPCTPKGIIALLRYGNIDIAGKHAVVLGRSNLVGKPIAQLLLQENATVTICHTHTQNLANIVQQADILVLAMGAANVVTPEMLKPNVVLVDVAMNWIDGKLGGDLYCEKNLCALEKIASAATPVPGGVGPMTITSLLENTFEIYSFGVLEH